MEKRLEATFVALLLSLAVAVASCDDNGTEPDADADGDSDEVETVVLTVETWTISPDGTERELPVPGTSVLLHNEELSCVSTPCDLEQVATGDHVLFLTLPGWVQEPIHLTVTQDGEVVLREENPAFSAIVLIDGHTVRVRMERDLTGTWVDEDGDETEITVSYSGEGWEDLCPMSVLMAAPFFNPTALCIEGDSLSLCKTRARVCYDNGLSVVTGRIDDGNVIWFRACSIYDTEACGERTYTHVD